MSNPPPLTRSASKKSESSSLTADQLNDLLRKRLLTNPVGNMQLQKSASSKSLASQVHPQRSDIMLGGNLFLSRT